MSLSVRYRVPLAIELDDYFMYWYNHVVLCYVIILGRVIFIGVTTLCLFNKSLRLVNNYTPISTLDAVVLLLCQKAW